MSPNSSRAAVLALTLATFWAAATATAAHDTAAVGGPGGPAAAAAALAAQEEDDDKVCRGVLGEEDTPAAPCDGLSLRQLRASASALAADGAQRRSPPGARLLAAAEAESAAVSDTAATRAVAVAVAAAGGRRSGNHSHQPAIDDYRRDTEVYLQTYPGGDLPSCNLRRVRLEEAEAAWRDALAHELREVGDQTLLEVGVDDRPWEYHKPTLDRNPYSKARKRFSDTLFGGLPGLVDGVMDEWPAKELWKTREDLVARLADRPVHLMNWTFKSGTPKEADDVAPETLAEYVAHDDSARNLFVFVNEPNEDLDEQRSLLEDLSRDAQPVPVFAARPEEKHAILAIDGAGSSHGFHRHSSVWQTQVSGRKAWWLMPPSVKDLGKYRTPPIVDGQVYGNPNACEMLLRRAPPPGSRACVMEPGDTVLLPEDWWHATCGLDVLTSSIGGWLQDQKDDEREEANKAIRK